MFGEEAEELAGVARIGVQRLRRHALFVAEELEPAGDFGGNVGGGKRAHGGQSGTAFFTLP